MIHYTTRLESRQRGECHSARGMSTYPRLSEYFPIVRAHQCLTPSGHHKRARYSITLMLCKALLTVQHASDNTLPGRLSEPSFSKPRAAHTTKMTASERFGRGISIRPSLSLCPLPVVEKTGFYIYLPCYGVLLGCMPCYISACSHRRCR